MSSEVNRVQQFLIDNMNVMHDVYPTIAKYWLTKRGLDISTVTRRNVGTFSATVRRGIEDLYANYLLLKSQVGIDNYL